MMGNFKKIKNTFTNFFSKDVSDKKTKPETNKRTEKSPKNFDSKLTPDRTSAKTTGSEEEKEPEQSPHSDDPLTQSEIEYQKHNRALRRNYAIVAVILASISIFAWIFFVAHVYICGYYVEGVHTEKVLGIITAACTINILTAFVSIAKGLFGISNKK